MGPRSKDPLRIIEAVYSFDNDERGWLDGIVDTLEPFSLSGGIAAYISSLSEKVAVRAFANRTALPNESLDALATMLPKPFYQRVHAPMPLTKAADVFPRAAEELALFDAAAYPYNLPYVPPPDAWALGGGDIDIETATVVFHCALGDEPPTYDKQILDHVGAHIGSALRLRRFIARTPVAEDAAVGAILAPDGTVLHADADAQAEAARAPLIDAVLRSERAKLRNATADERLEVWTALVEGKWSILESTERDGKRLLLAYKNQPVTRAIRALSARERIVTEYASLGHPLKYIAYELGISIATAAENLDTALRKLGVTSRAEMIQLMARRRAEVESSE